jgi:hypothetical protein
MRPLTPVALPGLADPGRALLGGLLGLGSTLVLLEIVRRRRSAFDARR